MLDLGSTFIQSVERNPNAPALVAEGKRLTSSKLSPVALKNRDLDTAITCWS